MTLTVLRGTGQVFWRRSLNLGVSDVFSRDLAGVMDLGEEYLKEKCPSHLAYQR